MSSPSLPPSRPSPRGSAHPESRAAWQLIRDDVFDRVLEDTELDRWLSERAKTSAQPHSDLIRLMLGMSLPSEDEARSLYQSILERRREMATALGRPVHPRVAALDFLTSRPASRSHSSRPIMIAPEFFERALEDAGSDAVTGLPRASHFMNLVDHELLQRSRRVAVVFLDLDGFKHVNDDHGHARGDEVLQTMAEAGRAVLRRGDVLARLGGDEFGLMLINLSLEEVQTVVSRLRQRFEELTEPLATSFSMGISIAEPGDSGEDMLRRADRAMYEEKRQRRLAR